MNDVTLKTMVPPVNRPAREPKTGHLQRVVVLEIGSIHCYQRQTTGAGAFPRLNSGSGTI
jgi:hypothetical protein